MSSELRPPIRILYPPMTPAIIKCDGRFPRIRASAQCTTPGFMVEILAAITEELGFQIVPVALQQRDRLNGTHFGSIVENKTNGILRYILEGKVDTIAIPFHDYGASRTNFDYSLPIYNTTAGFFYKKQLSHDNNWLEFFKVYNRTVWCALGLLLLVVIVFLHVAKCLEVRRDGGRQLNLKQRAHSHCEIIWNALQFMLGHAQYGKFKSGAVNWGLLILSCCYGFVVLGLYGSWILSLKLDPIVSTPMRDMNQLARLIRSSQFHMIATHNRALDFELLSRSNLPILRTLTDAIAQNPIEIMRTDRQLRQHLMHDRSVVYVEADEQLYLDLQKQCGIDQLQERLFNIPSVLVFPKGHPMLESINGVIGRRRDLFMKILNRYLGLDYDEINAVPCQRDRESQLLPYLGLLTMWFVLCVLGITVLFLEIGIHRVCGHEAESERATSDPNNKLDRIPELSHHLFGPTTSTTMLTSSSFRPPATSTDGPKVSSWTHFSSNPLVEQPTRPRRRVSSCT